MSDHLAPGEKTRVALVTGAAQGLGRATAVVLSSQDCRLILADLQNPEAALAQVREAGAEAEGTCGDVASEA